MPTTIPSRRLRPPLLPPRRWSAPVALTAAVSGLAGVVAASRDATPTQGHNNSVTALKAAQQAVRKGLVGVNVLDYDNPFVLTNTARAGFAVGEPSHFFNTLLYYGEYNHLSAEARMSLTEKLSLATYIRATHGALAEALKGQVDLFTDADASPALHVYGGRGGGGRGSGRGRGG